MPQRKSSVECPECGQSFSSRGLPGHLRFKHGIQTGRSSIPAGAAQEIRETLLALCSWVEKVDARLASLEASASGETQARQAEVLKRELAEVLAEIARAKDEAEQLEDSEDCESTAYKRLGELRLRQASILLKLGAEAPGMVADDDSMMGLLLK